MVQVWEVVGGAASGGVLVREGQSLKSPESHARLSTGALVKQLALEGERLNYQRLSGAGPEHGWVSLKSKDRDLLVRSNKTEAQASSLLDSQCQRTSGPSQLWQVVGGTSTGGVLVRQEQSIKSPECSQRLSTGAFVKQLALEGERLHYERLTGSGPERGWVTTKSKDRDLVIKSSKSEEEVCGKGPQPAAATEVPPASSPSPSPTVALMFPGQGSQYVGMLNGVKILPAVQNLLSQAREVLGWDVLELCLTGPEEKLEETRYCQPAMLVAGLAGLEQAKQQGLQPAMVAGLSLGEYTALCAAGVLDVKDALELVKIRAEAMQEAAGLSSQLMLSVAGFERAELDAFCSRALEDEPGGVCQVANCLFPRGYACAGTARSIQKLKELTEPDALQTKILKTSGAFHTQLMEPAAEKLSIALDEALPRMRPARCAIYANVTGAALPPGTEPAVIVELLKRQLTSPVLWEDSVRAMIRDGGTVFHEVGPMKQLKSMMKRIDLNVWKATSNIEV